jgi:hypothetical protein
MKPLRVSLFLAAMLMLSASTLSAQATRISCKDGSKPKVGHFSCWGHGGLVREATNPTVSTDKPRAEKKADKPKADKPKKEKSSGKVQKSKAKKAHSTPAKSKKSKKKKHATASSKSTT